MYSTTANRSHIKEYTISSANTWEKKTITISSGDTTGSWNRTNGNGLRIYWDFGSGSTYQASADTWLASQDFSTTNQAAWIGSASATFYITGVQLEVGKTATPFEHEDFGTTLAKCQRYYEISGITLVSNIGGVYPSNSWCVRKNHRPDITITPASGSGGVIAPLYDGVNVGDDAALSAWFQSVNHASDQVCVVFGDAEL